MRILKDHCIIISELYNHNWFWDKNFKSILIYYISPMQSKQIIMISVLVALVIPLATQASTHMMTSSMSMQSMKQTIRKVIVKRITRVWGAKMFSNKDIVSNVVNAPNLTTLVTAVKAAWLVATLQSEGPFTVFGPDNSAFAKLPSDTVATLLKPENKATLASILTYHVVSGRLTTNNLRDWQELTTVQGGKLIVKRSHNKITLIDEQGNTSTIVTPNVLQKNGVAHVIDTVLMYK